MVLILGSLPPGTLCGRPLHISSVQAILTGSMSMAMTAGKRGREEEREGEDSSPSLSPLPPLLTQSFPIQVLGQWTSS